MTSASPAPSSVSASLTVRSSASRILTVNFLEGHTSKKDLVLRLRKMISVVQADDTIDSESPEFSSGLSSLTQGLVSLVNHRDKQVRLYVVTLCMELFAVFAPNAPWDSKEIIEIFRQTIRQLANLGHTTQPNQSHYSQYVRILELLADVKIGIVLVELAKQAHDQSNGYASTMAQDSLQFDEDVNDGREALTVLKELFRTILQSIRLDHPPQVAELSQRALLACLEEYFEGILVPPQLLDELLICIGQGRTVLVTNPALGSAFSKQQQEQVKRGHSKNKLPNPSMPPLQVEQANPAYLVAASVVRKGVYRLSTPIATLLNGLLNGDPRTVQESDLLVHTTEDHAKAANPKSSSAQDASTLLVLDTPQRQQQTPTASVWSVIFELHKVAPSILTTVIGTVANLLTSPDETKRCLIVQLLGRLFAAKHSTMALEYRPCFREWLKRLADIAPQIRRHMTDILLELLVVGANRKERRDDWKDVATQVQQALGRLLEADTDLQVRLHVLHGICDTAYANRKVISADLLHRVAAFVTSKHKQERRDVLTGLAQMYFKQYISQQLRKIQAGGDDVDLQVIAEVVHTACHSPLPSRSAAESTETVEDGDVHDRFQWIPQIVFQCASYTDAVDTEMRSRVVQVVDDLLLGSELPNSSKKLTPTARAVGLAIVVDSLQQPDKNPLRKKCTTINSKGYHWMCQLLDQRAKLQRAVGQYLDARGDIRRHAPGSEEAMTANAKAEDLLETVAALTAPPSPSSSNSQQLAPGERMPVLQKFHALKDKRIFRILSTIATPSHSTSARVRALEELPKRVKQQVSHYKNKLGSEDDLLTWVKILIRRCAMGDFINAEIVHHCVLLAQECFHEEDVVPCRAFVAVIKVAVGYFPQLCTATEETFSTLVQLFTDARGLEKGSKFEIEVAECRLISDLSAILAAGAPANKLVQSSTISDEGLSSQLVKLCCGDGSPEEARLAVSTLAALNNPTKDVLLTQRQKDSFEDLLKALTMPSRLTFAKKSQSTKLISVLVSLAELAECSPVVFHASSRGKKAVHFAMEMILLGRAHSSNSKGDSDDDSESDSDLDAASPSRSDIRRKPMSSTPVRQVDGENSENVSPGGNVSLLEDGNLSIACRTLCAAMEFLASYIRASILSSWESSSKKKALAIRSDDKENNQSDSQSSSQSSDTPKPTAEVDTKPSPDLIENVFNILSQILRDHGLPPSSHDREHCKLRQNRAALRQCAAIQMLRLCDARLNLDSKFLTPSRWHTLSGVFLDDERVVREKVMEELGLMLTGNGKYRKADGMAKAMAPRLSMLALVTLCVDGDHGADHSAANGMAANVGKRAANIKVNAIQCVSNLRKIYEVASAQSRALGPRAEKQFETRMKVMLMPECVVPWAFHVLSFRRETPSAGAASYSRSTGLTQTSHDDEEYYEIDEGQQRVLRKRLKWLFDPLVHSLGDSADNISFLIRMTEVIGKNFRPVGFWSDFEGKGRECSPPSFRLSLGSDEGDEDLTLRDEVLEEKMELASAKLKIVCAAAREVLLSYVKKDINLTAYPGKIQVPSHLFQRIPLKKITARTSGKSGNTSLSRGGHAKVGAVKERNAGSSTGNASAISIDPIARQSSKILEQNARESLGSETSMESVTVPIVGLQSRRPLGPVKQSASSQRSRFSQDSADESIARRTRSSRGTSDGSDQSLRGFQEDNASSRSRKRIYEQSDMNREDGRVTRSARRSQGSLGSSQETDLSGVEVRRSVEGDNLSAMGSRASRVHFSPQLSIRSIPTPSNEYSENEPGNFEEGVSPIRMEGSPPLEQRMGNRLLGSGEKTCGTTPPSILRGATMSATASPDAEGLTDRESLHSQTSKSERGTIESDHSGEVHSPVADDEGDGTKTTSETHSSEEQSLEESHGKLKKRLAPGGSQQPRKKKQKAAIPSQIKVTRNKQPAQVKRGSSRVLRATNRSAPIVSNKEDSLEFDDYFDGPSSPKKTPRGSVRGISKKQEKTATAKRKPRTLSDKSPTVQASRKNRTQKI